MAWTKYDPNDLDSPDELTHLQCWYYVGHNVTFNLIGNCLSVVNVAKKLEYHSKQLLAGKTMQTSDVYETSVSSLMTTLSIRAD